MLLCPTGALAVAVGGVGSGIGPGGAAVVPGALVAAWVGAVVLEVSVVPGGKALIMVA